MARDFPQLLRSDGKAFAAIEPEARETFEADLYGLLDEFNIAEDGTLVIPSEYLEVVVTKRC